MDKLDKDQNQDQDQERNPRELESRDTDAREKPWTPPNLLPDPTPQDGYVFRWIRTAAAGQSDNMNVSTKMREGWTPVKAADHPELQMVIDQNSQFEGSVEVGGLLLCKAPEEEIKKRAKYFSEQATQQMDALDANYMREEDPSMPMFKERKSQVTFGKGGK
jgi:hypothetical protein|tara:strand:- start:641 stop:1126 length:486 start_codon:yes stop_codon:yes gene_type:complete